MKDEPPMFKELFARLKSDEHATRISKQEFIIKGFYTLPEIVQNCITNFHFESMGEVFDILDANGRGTLDEPEFVMGMLKLRVAELGYVPSEILLVLMHLRMSEKKNEEMAKLIRCRLQV